MAVSTAKAVWSVCLFVGHCQHRPLSADVKYAQRIERPVREFVLSLRPDCKRGIDPLPPNRIRRNAYGAGLVIIHDRAGRENPRTPIFSRWCRPGGGGVAVAVAGDIVVAKALQIRAAPDTQAIKTGKGVEGNGALRPCALHKSWGAHVSDGSKGDIG